MTTNTGLPPLPDLDGSALFLDFDGTLIGFADDPAGVAVPGEVHRLLERLVAATAGATALVSGRRIAALDALLAPARLPAAGLHGLERRDAAGRMHVIRAPGDLAHSALGERLKAFADAHPGVLFEDKGLAVSLHYRAAPAHAPAVQEYARSLAADIGPELTLLEGHSVIEIKPAGADKGTAIDAFLDEPPFAGRRPVFIGDDVTDEHGFAIVNARDGLSVKVGAGTSAARARLAGPLDVRAWLWEALRDFQPEDG